MAALASVQSFIAGIPVISGISTRNGLNHITPSSFHLPKRANMMKVRSMAGQGDEKEIKPPQLSQPNDPSDLPEPTQTNTAPKPKVSTKLEDIFAFSGAGPERINGRLAMIGFVTAMGVEVAKGEDLFSQIYDGGFEWFIGASIVLTLASLVPLFKGVTAETRTEGLMNSNAELWNGRFAMLGLLALAFTEYVKGGALV